MKKFSFIFIITLLMLIFAGCSVFRKDPKLVPGLTKGAETSPAVSPAQADTPSVTPGEIITPSEVPATFTPTPTATNTPTPTPTPIVYTFEKLEPETRYAYKGCNVRFKPDTIWDITGYIYEGTTVTITAKCIETGWYKIKYGTNQTGYVAASNLTTEVPLTIDISTVTPVPLPEYTSSGAFTTNIGETVIIALEGLSLANFKSYDESLILISETGEIQPLRAGKAVVSASNGTEELFFDISVFDHHRLDGAFVTKREITDDFWLTEDLSITPDMVVTPEQSATYEKLLSEGSLTLVRTTGLKSVSEDETTYTVEYNGICFNVDKTLVTTDCPAATPTPELPAISFSIKPGTLVNYDFSLLSTGDPENLINLISNKPVRCLTGDPSCLIQQEAINPLCVLGRDCIAFGEGSWFWIEGNGSYRTFSTQDRYWQKRLAQDPTYGDDPYNSGGTKCVPGVSSEHRTGYAFDISCSTAGFTWLNENSWKYGFIHRYTGDKTQYTGVMDEYWHYTYVGRDIAETCYKENLCLEEYYAKYVFE